MAEEPTDERGRRAKARSASTPLSVPQVARRAREQVSEVTGFEADSVSAVEKDDDVWRVTVNVVELHRVPASTNVLATYVAVLDANGDLTSYHRLRRYRRDQINEA